MRRVTLDDGTVLYEVLGQLLSEEEFDRAFAPEQRANHAPGGHSSACWPMKSEALGLHPKNVERANERNRAAGIGTRYDAEGFAHIPSRADRKKLLKLQRMFDKHGGYGD